jgi:NADPH-dependent 2,4-dienoyl-CoA reductase/sulfur reductase-like enzyme
METARVAAERGHRVTLLEKSRQLGGTALFSSLTTPMNGELVRYLVASLLELDVDVRTGTTATPEVVADLHPDAVVVATGAVRNRPDVPGAQLPHVLSGDDLRSLLTGEGNLDGRRPGILVRLVLFFGRSLGLTADMGRVRSLSRRWMPIGRRIVVVGGGLVGVELAEFLAERGRAVTVLEEGDDLATEMAHPRRWRTLHEARRHGVAFQTGSTVTGITNTHVEYRLGDVAHTAAVDTVVLAGGIQPDASLGERIREATGLDVDVIGDAATTGYIQGAIRSGNQVANAL